MSDWRDNVQQSTRNTEVRDIARVLAGLEPGATSASKLRLAMQFEDSIFKIATSYDDYKKRITKRLKKLKKAYVPTVQDASPAGNIAKSEQMAQELKIQYGDSIRFILKHAPKAVQELRSKHGKEKADKLKEYTDNVWKWGADLGLLEGADAKHNKTGQLSEKHVEALKAQVERQHETIRTHVVKYAEPDLFLQETLGRTEEHIAKGAQKAKLNQTITGATVVATTTRSFFQRMAKATTDLDPEKIGTPSFMKESMDQTQRVVPIQVVGSTDPDTMKQTALLYLDKMRGASSVLLAFMATCDNDSMMAAPTGKLKTLEKVHKVALESVGYVTDVVRKQRQAQKEVGDATMLEDAWTKTLVWSPPTEVPVNDVVSLDQSVHISALASKVAQSSTPKKIVTSSRVLFTSGRKAPFKFPAVLKRKRARLVWPAPNGTGTHLVLEFGKTFAMTIYFQPLLVTLRALPAASTDLAALPGDFEIAPSDDTWKLTPIHEGLLDRTDLSVWGASGDYQMIGSVVEARLRDASSHATFALRKYFSSISIKENAGEPDIELLEATALLEFLQLARSTFTPDWQDDDA